MHINIIGRGRVATHLTRALNGKAQVRMVNPHTLEGLNVEADITLISVSDDAISFIMEKLPIISGVLAHTSGSTPLDILSSAKCKNIGVFYPLQTFSKEKFLDYEKIPVFIEASDIDTENKLNELASLFSKNVKLADSKKRKLLHIASVFSCNFVNHLWSLAEEFLSQNGLEFCDLIPLIEETTDKIKHLSPSKAQTGPAARGDRKILHSHMRFIQQNEEMLEIYSRMSESIMSHQGLS